MGQPVFPCFAGALNRACCSSTCTLRTFRLARLNQLLNPSFQSRPWYHLLATGQQDENASMKLRARGHISAGRVMIGSLSATNIGGSVELNAGKLSLRDIRADLMGGHHSGNWDADFTANPPKYFGSGTVTKIAMTQVAGLMHDAWATGTVDGQYTLGLAGLDAAALRESATGSATFRWNSGSLRHVVLEGKDVPLTFSTFGGQLGLLNGSLTCEGCKLQLAGEAYDVTGSASFDRALNIRLQSSEARTSYAITGPLDKPTVEALPAPSSEAKVR